jgi:uncharacterized RDD family membrane protein YckC
MTDPSRSQWPPASVTSAQPSFLQPPAGLGHPTPPGYLTAPVPSDYATWNKRVRARLIDQLPSYLGLTIFCVGYVILIVQLARSDGFGFAFQGAAVAMIIGLGVMLASLGWVAYNRWLIAGRTGQSLGKRVMKIRLIGADTNAAIGPRNAFIRDLVHILDALTIVGYLWPLWDHKRHTFADQIMKTVVISLDLDAVEHHSGMA